MGLSMRKAGFKKRETREGVRIHKLAIKRAKRMQCNAAAECSQEAWKALRDWEASRDALAIGSMLPSIAPSKGDLEGSVWWLVVGSSSLRPLDIFQHRVRPTGPPEEKTHLLMGLAPAGAKPPIWRDAAVEVLEAVQKAGSRGWKFIKQQVVGGDAGVVWSEEEKADKSVVERVGWLAMSTSIHWGSLTGGRRRRAYARIDDIFDRRRKARRRGQPAPSVWSVEFGAQAQALWEEGAAVNRLRRDAAKSGMWPAMAEAKKAMLAAGATRVALCSDLFKRNPLAFKDKDLFEEFEQGLRDEAHARWEIDQAAKPAQECAGAEAGAKPRQRRLSL